MMANYQALLDSWQRAIRASEAIDVQLPDLALIIKEAQGLRHSWQSSSPSYLRHYLNEGEWGQAEEWSELARSVFAIFTAVYLMPPSLSEQICEFYIANHDLPQIDLFNTWLNDDDFALKYNEFMIYHFKVTCLA